MLVFCIFSSHFQGFASPNTSSLKTSMHTFNLTVNKVGKQAVAQQSQQYQNGKIKSRECIKCFQGLTTSKLVSGLQPETVRKGAKIFLRKGERKDYVFQYTEKSMVKIYMMNYTRESERETTNSSQFNSLCIGILHVLAPCSNSLAKNSLSF